MDIGKALTFVLEDPRWKEKIAIGTAVVLISGLLSVILIGFLGVFIMLGYMVRLMQNVRDGDSTPLPEWDEWGEDLIRGFRLFVVMFAWALPMLLFIVPVAVGGALSENNGPAGFIGMSILFCGMCFMFLYGLFLFVVTPGFSIAFARDERINSGLQLRDIWEWTQVNIGQVVIVAIVVLAATFAINLIAAVAGTILCLVGVVLTVPLGMLVAYIFQYHLYGQLAYEYPMGGMVTTSAADVDPSAYDLTTDQDVAPISETQKLLISPTVAKLSILHHQTQNQHQKKKARKIPIVPQTLTTRSQLLPRCRPARPALTTIAA